MYKKYCQKVQHLAVIAANLLNRILNVLSTTKFFLPGLFLYVHIRPHKFEFRSVSTCCRLILYSYEKDKMNNHARRRCEL